LAESEERFRALFEGAPIGISVVDLAGKEVASNKAYRDLVGIGATDELSVDTLLAFTNPSTREHDRVLFERIASGALAHSHHETEYARRDGASVWVDVSTFLQRDRFGKPRFVISMAVDITDQKRLEKQLRQAQKMETVGRLAGGIAHDFNNLLTVIEGYCDLILHDQSADTLVRTRTEHVDHAAHKAASLTHQLLAFSRQQVLQPKVFNLNALISDSGKMLSRLIGEDIEVNIRLAPNLGTVLADPSQIEQVVFNLAVNARDAMPDGGKLAITASNVALDQTFVDSHVGATPGQYVLLEVCDTGTGMDSETMAQIFDPFFTTKDLGKGTGLGLSMVYGIVKQSNGYIEVISEPGKGATFRVFLPRVDSAADSIRPENSKAELHPGNETVLLVEDDEEVRTLVADVLRSHGYKVLSA
jgi:two-component system, cell cycle sensor histidine kinase and response regulator CckA